jgi:voltage-gated potassium channel
LDSKTQKVRRRLYTIIYQADTLPGKLFDLVLILLILVSIAAVMLESVESVRRRYGDALNVLEWVITVFFTLEYIGRLFAVARPLKFMISRNGIVDLLATIPAYLGLFFPGVHFLISIRAIRLLRIFRILKLYHFIGASDQLVHALSRSRQKIIVFLFSVVVLCVILGTVMYLIEGPESGFTSIPVAVYWTIVTLTTVGFGDITPATPAGQFVSMVIMVLGYGIIAVPTGLVTAEYMARGTRHNGRTCRKCGSEAQRDEAAYCDQCGEKFDTA